ncbi:MAG TPA: putative quinol monooxygenase [Nitrospirota bacterium]|nr:putative quinol monooxygenase [Nitrospirota bacterium]
MMRKSDLIVLAKARALPGKEKELEIALRSVAEPTRAQPGCVAFSMLRSASDPSVIVGYERWASKKDHDRHLQGPHVQKLMSAMTPLLAGPPDIEVYELLDEK